MIRLRLHILISIVILSGSLASAEPAARGNQGESDRGEKTDVQHQDASLPARPNREHNYSQEAPDTTKPSPPAGVLLNGDAHTAQDSPEPHQPVGSGGRSWSAQEAQDLLQIIKLLLKDDDAVADYVKREQETTFDDQTRIRTRTLFIKGFLEKQANK
jgi:hypothetical protein